MGCFQLKLKLRAKKSILYFILKAVKLSRLAIVNGTTHRISIFLT